MTVTSASFELKFKSELKFSQTHVKFVITQKSAYIDHMLKYHQLMN